MTIDNGDHLRSFEAYVRANRPRLHIAAYRLCHDWHEAEDLVQAVLLKLYERWGWLTQRDQLGAYCRQALLRTYVSEHRRLRWSRELIQTDPPESEGPAHRVDDRLTLVAAMKRLGPRQRSVVVLRFWEDLSIEQTAQQMECSSGTVTSQTHRALNVLRSALADGQA